MRRPKGRRESSRGSKNSIREALSDAERKKEDPRLRNTQGSQFNDKKKIKPSRIGQGESDVELLRQSTANSRRNGDKQNKLWFGIHGLRNITENCIYFRLVSYILSSSGHKVGSL